MKQLAFVRANGWLRMGRWHVSMLVPIDRQNGEKIGLDWAGEARLPSNKTRNLLVASFRRQCVMAPRGNTAPADRRAACRP